MATAMTVPERYSCRSSHPRPGSHANVPGAADPSADPDPRVQIAVMLLARVDNRVQTPSEPDLDTGEVTQDAMPKPEEGGGHG